MSSPSGGAAIHPRRVIVTTPNREYNVRWPAVGARRLRHRDHRFEWTRAECQAWAERVAATYGYRAAHQQLGPTDPTLGAPSRLVSFDQLDDGATPTPVLEQADE